MQNSTATSALELISGGYSGDLWESLEDLLTNEDNPIHIHDVLKALHDSDKDKEAFALVRVLYDIAGLSMPDAVEALDGNGESRSAYITDLLTDIENII